MIKPCFTIFGGTGDLTFRKLLPALYNQSASGVFPPGHRILVLGRRDYTTADYLELARDWVKRFSRLPYQEAQFTAFCAQIEYLKLDFTDLAQYAVLEAYNREHGIEKSIYYFAVAPRFFSVITEGLSHVCHAGESKVILEKPFGENLEAAEVLSHRLDAFFTPERVYRIDHYLGKEMVRGIQTLRFANPVFADAWDAHHVAYVQISALEEVGVETRGGYYDKSGALRDMVQNHLFQILSILAMEHPSDFSPAAMHSAQIKILRALRPPCPEALADTLVLGQYEGYRDEAAVDPHSETETYAALRLFVDTPQWQDVPFYIRTGKGLGRREMSVTMVFRAPAGVPPNLLTIQIQPTEGVSLRFNSKRPGDSEEIVPTKMDFCQSCVAENRTNTPDAYERLLVACMRGERSWFSQWDQIETSWRYVDALRGQYVSSGLTPCAYPPGSVGPTEAAALPARFGHAWV